MTEFEKECKDLEKFFTDKFGPMKPLPIFDGPIFVVSPEQMKELKKNERV